MKISAFLKKSECTHMLGPLLPLFVFVIFSMTPPPSPHQRTYFLNDPYVFKLLLSQFYGIINLKIYLWSPSQAMADWRKEGKGKYKNVNILRTKKLFGLNRKYFSYFLRATIWWKKKKEKWWAQALNISFKEIRKQIHHSCPAMEFDGESLEFF